MSGILPHMPLTREKRIWPVILYSKITLVLLFLIVVVLAMSVYERFTIEREMQSRRAAAEAERAQLIERKRELEEKVEYLSADHGIEAEIRKHFDVAQDGEQVIVITENENDQRAAAAAAIVTPDDAAEEGWRSWLPW